MRPAFLLILSLSNFAATCPAYALRARDAMSSWKTASAAEKAALVKELLKDSGRASLPIVKCIDEAAKIPGHVDLEIGAIVKGCMASKNDSQPV